FLFVFLFFFFQAEDGIRDLTVTGVQTCALPIFTILLPRAESAGGRTRPLPVAEAVTSGSETVLLVEDEDLVRRSINDILTGSGRSEERRVGKECRCRWCAYLEKTKI